MRGKFANLAVRVVRSVDEGKPGTYICTECNEIVESKIPRILTDRVFCKQGHRATRVESFLRGVSIGLRGAFLITLAILVGLYKAGVRLDSKPFFIWENAAWIAVAIVYLDRGLGLRKRTSVERLFASYNYGIGAGLIICAALVDWAGLAFMS